MLRKHIMHRMEQGTPRSMSARVAAHLYAQPCSGQNIVGILSFDWRTAGP